MTSETTADASRKWRLRWVAYTRRHKPKIAWLCLAGLAVLYFGNVAPSHTRISCNDPSIRHEFRKDTISIGTLFAVSLLVPFFVMALFEYLVPPPGQTPPNTTPLRACLRRSWSYFTDLFVGVLFTYFLTDIIKTTVGEARPNFWATCRPNLTEAQCAKPYITVTWADCTNPNLSHWRKVDTMKSFPSGHASISAYAAAFMIVYTHKRVWKRWSSLLSPWLQMMWLTFAIVCCQSRVWDNKHFWWDTLVGAIIGAVGGMLTVHFLTDWFERADFPHIPSTSKEDSPPPSSSSSYIPEEEEEEGENSSSFSRTSIKRLITGAGEKGEGGGGGGGGGGGSERELRNVSTAP